MENMILSILYLGAASSCFFSSCQMARVDALGTIGAEQTYLALGDSYTIGESVEENRRFPVQLVDAFRQKDIEFTAPRIIAMTGWTTLDLENAILKAKIEGQSYDLVSLLIGVNDQYQGLDFERYEPDFRRLLELAIKFAGGNKTKVFVVSIPDYAYTPFGQTASSEAISKEISAYNAVNRRVSSEFGIDYIDITPISQLGLDRPALVAEDGLHPSGAMYQLWVELILKEKLEDVR